MRQDALPAVADGGRPLKVVAVAWGPDHSHILSWLIWQEPDGTYHEINRYDDGYILHTGTTIETCLDDQHPIVKSERHTRYVELPPDLRRKLAFWLMGQALGA